MTPKKYKPERKETKIAFVTRIVTSENRAMTAAEVVACIDNRSMRYMNPKNIHANLSDAVGKYDLIGKTRMMSNGKKRVNYHPVGMVLEGEDIPVPAFTKEGGNTFVNEEQSEDPTGVLTLDEDGMLQHKPDAVKVAEKVIADLGGDYHTTPPTKPRTKRVAVDKGWVEMVDGIPKSFTPNALSSIAETMNWTLERTERVIISHLRQWSVEQLNSTMMHCLIQMLQQSYGRAPLNRME